MFVRENGEKCMVDGLLMLNPSILLVVSLSSSLLDSLFAMGLRHP